MNAKLTVKFKSEIGTAISRAPDGGDCWYRADVYRGSEWVASSGWRLDPDAVDSWLVNAYPELVEAHV